MTGVSRYLPVAVLLAGSALVWSAHGHRSVSLVGSLQSVLAVVPGLRTVDNIISPEERRVAGMTDYVFRSYRASDSSVSFTAFVSYYDRQATGRTIHSPRNCLPGAGWEIVQTDDYAFPVNGRTHNVNRVLLRNGGSSAIAFYWYQGRGRIASNEYRVKWNLLTDAALLGRSEEALVRIVVPVREGSEEDDANAVARTVAPHLIEDLNRVLPSVRGRRI